MRALIVLIVALPAGIVIGWRSHSWWRQLSTLAPDPPASDYRDIPIDTLLSQWQLPVRR